MSAQSDFNDYYFILQVHQNAEPEIIKSAYRRLAQMNHPDLNPDPQAITKMQLINQAYKIISNQELRRVYHVQWLRYHQKENENNNAYGKNAEAHQVLDAYFRCLLQEDWVTAYQKLADADRAIVPLGDFQEWKEAVNVLYQMGSYVIKPFRLYEHCTVGEKEYEKVHVFSVFLTDRDKRTGNVSEEPYTKYVVLDKENWKVCLGYMELKPIIYKLKYLATQAPEMDPSRIYMNTLLKYDKLTGLLSRNGLLECMDREIARKRRFKNNFCLAVLSIEPSGRVDGISSADYSQMCVSNAASNLRNTLRAIDYAARFSESQMAILLIETEYTNAVKAINRFIRALKKTDSLEYTISGSVTEYQGETAEDTLIRASNDAKMQITVGADRIKKYRVKLDGQQV